METEPCFQPNRRLTIQRRSKGWRSRSRGIQLGGRHLRRTWVLDDHAGHAASQPANPGQMPQLLFRRSDTVETLLVLICRFFADMLRSFYLIASRAGPLLMGDIMAVLAECRNRQDCGIDRWGGLRHYTGELVRWEEEKWEPYHWAALDRMPDDVSINVAIEMPWGYGGCPAFSLRRVYGTERFLHEMILHEMIMDQGHEYQWAETSSGPQYRPVNKSKYRANLLAVKEHRGRYLSTCSTVFRLLSEVNQPG